MSGGSSNVVSLPIGDERTWLEVKALIDAHFKKHGFPADLREHVLDEVRSLFLRTMYGAVRIQGIPVGAEAVRIRFDLVQGKAQMLTVEDGPLVVRAQRVPAP